MKRTISIALAFVGLLVGAGFATGQEVIQYFVSFGNNGIWGAVVSGLVMALAGAVILGLGSYFLADEHNKVFRNVSHPIMSKFLDVSVTLTLFAIGFVMLAGAGSNLEQQFGVPPWIGAGAMTLLVMITGLLNVDKVSNIISSITPLIIIAIIGVFIYTMANLPEDYSALDSVAREAESPVRPWWLSALNYNGMALMLGVSMSLVIGGSYSNPKAAFRGGLWGGILYTGLLLMATIVLFFNIQAVGDVDVPMLELYDSISPVLSFIMVWIILAMIYNTAIGMFYALGRRVTASRPSTYRPVFLILCVAGYAVSFIGFDNLMTYVYPVIGYVGIVMVAILVIWWVKHRRSVSAEHQRRRRIYELTYKRDSEKDEFTDADDRELRELTAPADAEPGALTDAIEHEVATDLGEDEATVADSALERSSKDR